MKKVILVIMDGWGVRQAARGNAIAAARKPNFDSFWKKYPHCLIESSGEAVGLPLGQMGTSEVNHMVIGAGRVIFQDLMKINHAIKNDDFSKNSAIIQAMEHVKTHGSTLHLQGLLSSGGVHSHQTHFYALLSLAKRIGVKNVLVHVFTDGRDTLPKSALTFIKELQSFMENLGLGRIASISGRFFAMDRDNHWERVDAAFDALTKGTGKRSRDPIKAIEEAYEKNVTDEFIEPTVIETEKGEAGCVESDDALIFVNFRSDRAVELSQKFLKSGIKNLNFVSMTQYRKDFDCQVAFPPEKIENTLGDVISAASLKQLRITETEKFNHLTYFFNSKRLEAQEGEDRIMLDSYSDIKTHDAKPEMRTPDIAGEIVEDIAKEKHAAIFTNLCNCDMVGHTVNMPAAIRAVETVDAALGKIVGAALKKDYAVIITADHGNAEELIDEKTGEPLTSHTLNPVPFILVSKTYKKLKKKKASLADVAPTILSILKLPKPVEMAGVSLV